MSIFVHLQDSFYELHERPYGDRDYVEHKMKPLELTRWGEFLRKATTSTPFRLRLIVEMWEIYGTDCVFAATAANTVYSDAKLRPGSLLDARDDAVIDEERPSTGIQWPVAPALPLGKDNLSADGAVGRRTSEEAGKERPSKKKAGGASQAGGAKTGKAPAVVKKTSKKSSADGSAKRFQIPDVQRVRCPMCPHCEFCMSSPRDHPGEELGGPEPGPRDRSRDRKWGRGDREPELGTRTGAGTQTPVRKTSRSRAEKPRPLGASIVVEEDDDSNHDNLFSQHQLLQHHRQRETPPRFIDSEGDADMGEEFFEPSPRSPHLRRLPPAKPDKFIPFDEEGPLDYPTSLPCRKCKGTG